MVSKDEYKKAKKIVDEYELAQNEEFKKMLKSIEIDLKKFFSENKIMGKTISQFSLRSFMGQKDIVEIITDCFNANYKDDASDKKIMDLGNKYDVWLHFNSSIYTK